MGRSGQTRASTATRARRRPDPLERKVVAPQPCQQETFAVQRAAWEQLAGRVFEFGGEKIVMPTCPDADLPLILERGELWNGKGARLKRGKPCNCHQNSAYLFNDGHGRVATGYALTDDGYWRQHSWIVTGDGRVIETTTRRVSYFGVLLTEEECAEWVRQQIG